MSRDVQEVCVCVWEGGARIQRATSWTVWCSVHVHPASCRGLTLLLWFSRIQRAGRKTGPVRTMGWSTGSLGPCPRYDLWFILWQDEGRQFPGLSLDAFALSTWKLSCIPATTFEHKCQNWIPLPPPTLTSTLIRSRHGQTTSELRKFWSLIHTTNLAHVYPILGANWTSPENWTQEGNGVKTPVPGTATRRQRSRSHACALRRDVRRAAA